MAARLAAVHIVGSAHKKGGREVGCAGEPHSGSRCHAWVRMALACECCFPTTHPPTTNPTTNPRSAAACGVVGWDACVPNQPPISRCMRGGWLGRMHPQPTPDQPLHVGWEPLGRCHAPFSRSIPTFFSFPAMKLAWSQTAVDLQVAMGDGQDECVLRWGYTCMCELSHHPHFLLTPPNELCESVCVRGGCVCVCVCGFVCPCGRSQAERGYAAGSAVQSRDAKHSTK